ncbi:hypothetical protein QQF64_028877 [Cirrhinus molitorella]|uniref:Uncharacterized protein n=1 Tax=Cirrhinus molitorella TaxID=172907 RepID=A0ABR3N7W5_9TELE
MRIGINENDDNITDGQECSSQMMSDELDQDDVTEKASETESQDLAQQLEHNLAALFLKMQAILHIPESSVQEVIQQICQIVQMSQPLLHKNVEAVLQKHFGHIGESVVKEVVETVAESNILSKSCGKNGCLATSKRRATYVKCNFPLVMPIEYVVEKGMKTVAYVPLLQMLQKLLNKKEILEKVTSLQEHIPHEYRTCQDGSSFRENSLLNCGEFTIALGLYIDDFEVANPLGTSKGKHKMCAVYWIIANLPAKFRSALNTVQLALLCNTETVKECGYDKILYPLLSDLASLEQHGVYIERLGKSVKGSVLFVAADNLGAHSLAGFFESFRVDKFCRFCMASRTDAQLQEVRTGAFELREKGAHNRQVQESLQDPNAGRNSGVKGQCPLTSSLEHFHVIGGYPPDILHDVFEGIVPVELSLCIKDLVAKKYITLDVLNHAIKSFPYTFSDKTDKPQVISKSFTSRDTIGGNGHENWCLIRILPLLIGHYIPSGDNTWEILMLLKDIVALVVSPQFTEESLYILDYKVAEHRELLQSVFPDFKLRPKHHYIEHYSHLIRVHGPLTEVWTMRFEAKHKFFKKMDSPMILRVILTEADIRKIRLTTKPCSVDDLISCLKTSLALEYNFTLQFQDPDFNNDLVNLTNLSELPPKPTVKIIPFIEVMPVSLNDTCESSEALSDAASSADTVLVSTSPQEPKMPWPEVFFIPKFSVDVEYRLRQANLVYLRDGTLLKLNKELKHDILHKLAEHMYSFKAYPTSSEICDVAKALVEAHPCLRESGSPSGYSGWTQSLKDKMCNYRSKMRNLGHTDVMVNAGKRGRYSVSQDPPNKNIKKPRKGEVNYLPDCPDGHDDSSLEIYRQELVDEMKKKKQSAVFISQRMDLTLSFRRKEVVIDKPPVSQLLQRWPALVLESQVYQEFSRVVGKNLKQEFYGSLDRHCPQLMQIFRSKRGLTGQILSDLLQQIKISDLADMRCAAIRGLPVILGDDPTEFFTACFSSADEGSFQHVPLGILIKENEAGAQHPQSFHLHSSSVGIILEGNVVMDNLENLPQAMCLLFGLTYSLHLDYPKCMTKTFHFIQQVMLGLGKKELKGKVLSVSNQLTI